MTPDRPQDQTRPPTLWYGGSFDPIHHGHLIVARAVAETANFGRVVLVPNHLSPLKLSDPSRASASDRVTMCRAAIAGDPLFEVDTVEVERPPPSFTFDTIVQIRPRFGALPHWLIGMDSVPTLPKWHRWQELLSLVNFVVMGRPGERIDWTALPPAVQKLRSSVVDAPLIQISSTEIRARVSAGRSVRNLLPAPVEQYIRQQGLYGSPKISL